MIGCIWLYVTYVLIICHLTTSLYVRCILECFDYMYQSCRLVTRIYHLFLTTCVHMYVYLTRYCLCMLIVACGNVCNGVMVFVMHEVIACIVDMALL